MRALSGRRTTSVGQPSSTFPGRLVSSILKGITPLIVSTLSSEPGWRTRLDRFQPPDFEVSDLGSPMSVDVGLRPRTSSDYGTAIAVEGAGNVFVAGLGSTSWGARPIRPHGGVNMDAFEVKLSSPPACTRFCWVSPPSCTRSMGIGDVSCPGLFRGGGQT
jgi:hypothetical protein